ncbi:MULTISPECIES: hypothetical protein [Bacillota]|uniref:hypothetical protein n=1 Tax=Bacillota TaxID=1239 RepID=UPI0039EF1B2B
MNKKAFLEILEPHKEHITTIKAWDAYAKNQGLPPSVTLIYHFKSWSNVKRTLGVPNKYRSYKFSELEEIAFLHKDKFRRKSIWDEYSKKNGLPASATFIKAFGSWQKLKVHIGLGDEKRKDDLYSREDIEKILTTHAEHYENRKQWDEYAKENKLPTYKTIKKHFDYNDILSIVNKRNRYVITKEELINLTKCHKERFLHSSMTRWDDYASENHLPSSQVYFRVFGSWNKAKNEITLRT